MDSSLRVLIVEDDIDQASLIAERLKHFNSGFIIDTVRDGAQCLEQLANRRYEAVILEHDLPRHNALDVLSEINKAHVDTPVVVVSKQGADAVARESLKRGACNHVVKDSNFLIALPQVVEKSIEQFRLAVKLKESELKYKIIFEKSNDAIVILSSKDFRILEANLSAIELSGYTEDELILRKLSELFPPYQYSRISQVLEDTQRDGRCKNDTLSIVTRFGQAIPVELDMSMIRFGESRCVLCNIRNIAEKKELQTLILNSKRRLQNTFDGITDIIFEVDKKGRLVIVNKRFAELYDSEPKDLINEQYHRLLYNSEAPVEDCPVQATFRSGEPRFLEYAMADRLYDIWTYPIFSVNGSLTSVAVYAKDVTDKKKFEKTLIQSEKLATIGLLASGIAHELRNPLNVIETARYYIEEFLAKKDTEVCAKLDIIHKNVKRSSKIINNLLEFSRHSEYERELIDLRSLIENTVSLIQKELDAKNIEFKFHCGDHTTTYFSMDSLKQVLLNLIINAIQAMRRGGKLTVSVEQGKKDSVQLKIADTGVGIPKKNLPHIFSPFFTTKEVGEGTGLGLYISHMIITREGGNISVDSQENVGTTFTVTLPKA